MQPDILSLLKTRYTCKDYDPQRKISETDIETLATALTLTPSSTNSQPWKFLIVSNPELKEKISTTLVDTPFQFNQPLIKNASHLIIFTARLENSLHRNQKNVQKQISDKRITVEEAETVLNKMEYFATSKTNYHNWTVNQTYIALGQLLLIASMLDIDTTAMEGFYPETIDKIFNLTEMGYSSTLLVALGYHSATDTNKNKPKSRFNTTDVVKFYK